MYTYCVISATSFRLQMFMSGNEPSLINGRVTFVLTRLVAINATKYVDIFGVMWKSSRMYSECGILVNQRLNWFEELIQCFFMGIEWIVNYLVVFLLGIFDKTIVSFSSWIKLISNWAFLSGRSKQGNARLASMGENCVLTNHLKITKKKKTKWIIHSKWIRITIWFWA